MAEITRKRTGQFLRKLFEFLMGHPEGLQAGDALAQVRQSFELSEYEKGTYGSGEPRFDKIVRFATVDCVKAGWLLKNKGQWTISDAGKAAYAKFKDPEVFYKEAVKLYREWKHGRIPILTGESKLSEDAEPDDKAVSITFEQAEEQAWQEVRQYLETMPPYDFQALVAALLKGMGYHIAWIAPPGRDGGVDIQAQNDPLGAKPPRIKVQVKRLTTQKVSVEGLRSFLALLGEDDVGLFVSMAGFTKEAEDLARTQEKRRVTLVDLERLFDLWVEHYSKLDESARRSLPLQPIYFLAPTS